MPVTNNCVAMQYTSLVSIALDCQCLSKLNVQLNTSYKIKLKSVFPNLLVRSLLVSILSCSSVVWWQHGVSDLSVFPPHTSEGRIICIWQNYVCLFSLKNPGNTQTYWAIFHMLSKSNMAVFAIPYLSTTESIGDVNFAHRYRYEIGSKVPRPFNVSLLLAAARDYH